ncbi:Ig-like domain-containing protein [Pinibacter aurantiacus]|uniref:Ig-like domain-containing protein n=1 Tax=Pinibacter aurantiacus TaxID=2851599 RepID=A0A9E2S4P5_9BACT|nr:Ig-like domain-containing protein [Pinibacter aurantiacus]MBV4355836.1 Ig-like domain-containing protein [Pinibacter aurantiacus]
MKKIWRIILSVVFSVWLPKQMQATNITVSSMIDLQTALATTVDTIYITPDAYTITNAFVINRTVTIIGLPGGSSEVVIKMSGTQRHFTISGAVSVAMNGLVLVGPNADYSGGIFIPNGGIFIGGGCSVAAAASTFIVSNCKIGGCNANGSGGAIVTASANNTLEINSSRLDQNSALNHGGGVYALGSFTMFNDTISNNKAGYNIATGTYTGSFNGGGVYANDALILKGGITIQNDTASNFGGGIYKGAGTINSSQLISFDIYQNRANASGGGIYNISSSTTFTNVKISNNSAKAGGGIYNTGSLTLTNIFVRANNSETTGGGIHTTASLTLMNATVTNNIAGSTGGGIHTTAALTATATRIDSNIAKSSNGGGVFNGLSANTITINNSVVNSNRAWNNGGGVYAAGPLVLSNDTISGNKACYDAVADTFRIPKSTTAVGSGGGIFANHNLSLSGSILMERDTSVVCGGGIYKGSAGSLTADPNFPADPADLPDTLFATVSLDTLVMNYCVTTGEAMARNGDPNSCQGGAIFTAVSTTIQKASFFQNSSGDSGGVVWGDGNNTIITLENIVAINNKAGYNPFTKRYYADCSGGVACTPGRLVLSGDLLFQRDTAANVGGALVAYQAASNVTSSNLKSLTIAKCATVYATDAFGVFIPLFRGQGGAICANLDIILEAENLINIIDNTSYTYGGALYSVNKGIMVKKANISGNTARYHGGALYAPNGSVFIDSCSISHNRAGYDPFLKIDSGAYNGGAVYASKELRLSGTIVMDSNSANNNGGAIAKIAGGRFNIADVTALRLRGNQTKAGPGGKGNGGAIYIDDSLILNSSINLEINNNRAAANGGAIYSTNKFLSLSEITIGNNHADSAGGAVWSGGQIEMLKVTLDSNSAGTNGGAVYSAAGKMNISASTFFRNNAGNGGAVYRKPVIATDSSKIFNSTFSGNSATNGSGGALYESGTIPARITFATFNDNTASDGNGNAIFFSAITNKQLRGNIIYGNGNTGTEINQTAFRAASYNIVRNTGLTGGVNNLNLAPGNAAGIFENIISGDKALLSDNGDLTQTIAIKRNGYAHNYVPSDTSNAWSSAIELFSIDQRDSARPAGCRADAGAYELQAPDDPASYSIQNDTICGNSFVNADTLIKASQFIIDTFYFKNKAFTDSLAMPVQVNTATPIYVKFITTSNCELFDTLTVIPLPLVDSIAGNDVVVVNKSLPLQTTTQGGVWSSKDTSIAKVDQSGLVTGISLGQTEIVYTLTADTCTSLATKPITVIQPPLPLTLISFSGNRQSGNDYLSWTSTQEVNFSHFEVEFSTDGLSFTKAGEVVPTGNNSPKQYSFVKSGVTGILFYRLKMVDIDNSYKYSWIIQVSDGTSQGTCVTLTVSPVPFADKLNIRIYSCRKQQLQLSLLNITVIKS